MKYSILTILACILVTGAASAERVERGNLVTENIPEPPPALRERLGQYQNARAASIGGWPADGAGLYVVTGFGETPQAHVVEAPGGARRQLTFYDDPVVDLAPSPTNSNFFAFARDSGGDENFQIYVFDRTIAFARRLSDGVGRKGSVIWSPDGGRLAWYTTTGGSMRAIVVAEVENPDSRQIVFTGDGWWAPVDWAPDGATLLLRNYISINESTLHLLDIASGTLSQINPSQKKISYGDAKFSHDGVSVYYTSDESGEYLSLHRYNITDNETKNLTEDISWDVEGIAISPTGEAYAFVVNEGGRSALYVRTRKDRPLPAPALPPSVVRSVSFSPDGKQLGFTANTATAPGDVFSLNIGQKESLKRWTLSEIGGLDPAGFTEPEFFSYTTFDGANGEPRRIPAIIYKPDGPGPYPVVIRIHGGPEGQARPVFSANYQYWVNELGIAVVTPNVRGSRGYGKSYLKLDNGFKREDAVRDIGALLDWISAQPNLDESRVIVYGGSYGGYMALASMLHFSDRLAGAVDIVGISDFVTFLENTAAYRRNLRRAEYGDERDPEMRAFLRSISPLRQADKLSKPILIAQGLNDPRVPASESQQIFDAVRANGGEPWFMLAKDEGHGFKKRSNRKALSEAVVLFFAEIFDIELPSDIIVEEQPGSDK